MAIKIARRTIKWSNASVSPSIVVIGARKGYLHSDISSLILIKNDSVKGVTVDKIPGQGLE